MENMDIRSTFLKLSVTKEKLIKSDTKPYCSFPYIKSEDDYEGVINYILAPINKWRFKNIAFPSIKKQKDYMKAMLLEDCITVSNKLIIKKTTNITKRANVLNSPNIVSYVVNTNNVNIVVELSPVDIEYIKGLNKSEDIFKELFVNNFNRLIKLDMNTVLDLVKDKL